MDKFWSDDFDMDLLKIFPSVVVECLGILADTPLWTPGHETYGRLNHPVVWNTHGAFVWLDNPELDRDKYGWFNVGGCVDDSQMVECTWLELLRDQWPHGYSFLLMPEELRFPGPRQDVFDDIMYDLRGWRKQDVTRQRAWVVDWLTNANRKLDLMIQRKFTPSTS